LAAKLESRKQSEESKSTNPSKADRMSGEWRTVYNALGVVMSQTSFGHISINSSMILTVLTTPESP